MIIVLAEGQIVSVLSDISSVRRDCETVDVEDGVIAFLTKQVGG